MGRGPACQPTQPTQPKMTGRMMLGRLNKVIVLSGLIAVSGCGSSTGTRSNFFSRAEYSSAYLGKFDKLWAERTVLLTSEHQGGGMPFVQGSPDRGEGSPFPLSVRATLMDSAI